MIDAAEETRSPVLIGFNGQFPSGAGRLAAERISWYAPLARAAAESASVPCGLVFNECPQADWSRAAVTSGFGQVMPDDPHADRKDFVRRALGNDKPNPYDLLGCGGQEDMIVAGRLAVRDAIIERIERLGCCGRA